MDAEEKLREERKQHRAVRGLHGCRSGIGPAQIVHRVREQTVERRVTYHAGENCDAEESAKLPEPEWVVEQVLGQLQ